MQQTSAADETVGKGTSERSDTAHYYNRRKFLTNLGGVSAAACTVATVGLEPLIGSSSTQAAAESSRREGGERAEQAFQIRRTAAIAERHVSVPRHSTNGDEQLYPNKIGNYSKGLPHNSIGEVDPAAYASLLTAISSGDPTDFDAIALGGTVKLVNPQAGLAFDLEGTDSGQLSIPPSPAVASEERADEMVELYWQWLLRDVNFMDYATNATALAACAELGSLRQFTGPKLHGRVTPQTLFRGFTTGDITGPYISQFLLQPIALGPLPITQQFTTYLPTIDYLTDVTSWMNLRNGIAASETNSEDPTLRHIRNGRDMGAWVHIDALFQAYLQALLWLLGNRIAFNVGNPYNGNGTQAGFGTFGGPHIIALMSEVSSRALKAEWSQKWFVHRALRPEEFGGLVHFTKTGQANYPLHGDVLKSQAVQAAFKQYGTYLLPQAYPEGCPQHPAYASGHSTVAGACVTMLKAFFNTDNVVFPNPVVPSEDGLSLLPYTGPDTGHITLTGELHKLAANIGIGRDHAGIHWRSDYVQAVLLGEQVAINILKDQRSCYNETFAGFTLTKFDGTAITV
jgi:hypothetical protein